MTGQPPRTATDDEDAEQRALEAQALRRRAEASLKPARISTAPLAEVSPYKMERTLHELHVHQVELQMQNDELRRTYADLEASRSAYFDLYNQAPVGYVSLNPSNQIQQANLKTATLLGVAQQDLPGVSMTGFIARDDQDAWYLLRRRCQASDAPQTAELHIKRPDGSSFWAELTASAAPGDADAPLLRVVFSDISTFKAHQSQMEHLAHYDLLTNLPSRALLTDRLRQSMATTQRHGSLLAVGYIDLDSFKSINDRHGHEVGDQLLVALATRMKETLREGDTLARIGGDEFVAVLTDLASPAASLPMLKRLLDATSQRYEINGLTLQVSASLGVTFYPQADITEADQLLRQADQAMYQAMYQAKQTGKNRYHLFDAEHDRDLRGHHDSINRIRQALTSNELLLYYQPKVNMRTGAVIGAEALIRWQHPEKGLVSPAEFLPVMEADPLAIEVGEWVIDTALAQMAQWQAQGLNLQVSVNVGALQLQQPNFVARLQAIMQRYPTVQPDKFMLEMLETSALLDIGYASQVIEDCRQLGVTFALDDFGTGYSSLTYLRRLGVAVLKIDQSFVRDMLNNPDDQSILRGVIGLADAFHRQVIAEGVETIAHGSLLLQLGCDQAQGYGVARPMPAANLPDWVATWQPDAAWTQAAGAPATFA